MKSFRKVCRGEKGFTLIELLVVIMILGVLAAVVTLAVTRFIGKGTVESANAEKVTVEAAVEACLADANTTGFTATVSWTGDNATSPKAVSGGVTYSAYDYMRTHTQKATYTVSAAGSITNAVDGGTGGTWGGVTFNTTTMKWAKT